MKLFVDDIRQPPDGWHCVRTNTDAIRLLATGKVEEISLDHDIAWTDPRKEGIPWVEETYKPIAYYLSLYMQYPPRIDNQYPKVVFHTANFEAGREMAKIIGIPFVHVSGFK